MVAWLRSIASPCVTTKSKASVYICSKNKTEETQCISDGIEKATKIFTGIKIVEWPRNSTTVPCKPAGIPAPTPAPKTNPLLSFFSF
ncbi:hypothetical protein J6590_059658 [Homalodisca vitripennis]|nr:hypothetical protein J6590_059658 [Homalodisca vitripennis]